MAQLNSGGGGSVRGGKKGGKKGGRPDPVQTYVTAPDNPPFVPPGTGGGGGSTGSTGSGGGSRGGGGGGYDPYKAALRRENAAKKRASDRYVQQAKNLQGQINALNVALGKKGFLKALKTRLANITLVTQQGDAQILKGYRARVGSLDDAAENNAKAAADSSQQNLANRSRERANAVSEATLQGAGESDLLRAQQMSLRSWSANQNEINRSFYDGQQTINASLTDLNIDTRNARANLYMDAEDNRDAAWTDYYNRRSETLTQMGNLFGQRSELYGLANEQVASKKNKGRQKQAVKSSDSLYKKSALVSGMAYKKTGLPAGVQNWEGRKAFDEGMANSRINNASAPEVTRPEGATLRKWTA